MTTFTSVTPTDVDALRAQIDDLGANRATSELVSLAHAQLNALAQTERELDGYRRAHVDLWKLMGRCEYAFELIAHSASLKQTREAALQLLRELADKRAT